MAHMVFRVWQASNLGSRSSHLSVALVLLGLLPILFGGAKELGIVHISIIRGAKEPRNLQNHRGVIVKKSLLRSAAQKLTRSWHSCLQFPIPSPTVR